MVYQRVPRPPLSINDFVRTRTTTDDDLLKVTFEDGGELFFTFTGEPNVVSNRKWRLDKQLLPENLTAYLREHHLEGRSDFVLTEDKGYVGRAVRLNIEPATNWDVTMWFVSEAVIKSIRPARRPRKPAVSVLSGKIHSERSSDYH